MSGSAGKRRRSPRAEAQREEISIITPESFSPISMLPVDLLLEVMSYIPLWPRLHAVSLVSKRWRTIVLRSVTSFPRFRKQADYLNARSLFPSARSLNHKFALSRRLAFPTNLHKLSIASQWKNLHLLGAPPPSLTSLTLPRNACVSRFYSWLHAMQSSLTKLSCRFGAPDSSAPEPKFNVSQLSFPSLTCLKISEYSRSESLSYQLADLLARHSSQLVKLSINSEHWDFLMPRVTQSPYSRLRTLTLDGPLSFADAAPNLTELNFSADAITTVPERYRPILRALFVAEEFDVEALAQLCPRLEEIPIRWNSGVRPQTLARLVSLKFYGLEHIIDLASKFSLTRLTKLSLGLHSVTLEEGLKISLPVLRHASFFREYATGTPYGGLQNAIDQVRALVNGAPRLQTLTIALPLGRATTEGEEGFLEFAKWVQQRGVEVLDITESELSTMTFAQRLWPLPWLQVKIYDAELLANRVSRSTPSRGWELDPDDD